MRSYKGQTDWLASYFSSSQPPRGSSQMNVLGVCICEGSHPDRAWRGHNGWRKMTSQCDAMAEGPVGPFDIRAALVSMIFIQEHENTGKQWPVLVSTVFKSLQNWEVKKITTVLIWRVEKIPCSERFRELNLLSSSKRGLRRDLITGTSIFMRKAYPVF